MQGSFKGISFRLAKVGIVAALVIGFFMSALQLYLDFQSQKALVAAEISRILEVSQPPAARSVYTLDHLLAMEVAKGIMKYDFILNATIQDESGNILAYAKKPHIETNTRWITQQIVDKHFVPQEALLLVGDGEESIRGTLKFVVDMDAAYQPFYAHSKLVISIGLLRSTILVVVLFFVFYFLLTKPLIRIATQIKNINLGSPGEQRLILPDKTREDELQQIVNSGNQLLDAVDLALAKRRAVEVVLRKSEEHVRQIIDSLPVWVGARNRDGHYIFANKALADFLDTTPEAMRGSHISDFSKFYVSDPLEVVALDSEVIDKRQSAQIWEEVWVSRDGKEHQMHIHVMPMEFYDEVVALVVSSDISDLKKAQQQMEHMAYHDALTDLPNRSYLVERLHEEIRRSNKSRIYGALLFIDLDNFKYINDSLGHPAGDDVLKHVANRLREMATENDIVVRLGGDEFVVVLSNLGRELSTAIIKAEEVGESLRSYVSEPHYYNDLNLHVTCSVGIVIFPEEEAGVHELLRYADTAMYQVKEQGRNAIQFFNRYMADKARNVLVMDEALHKALKSEQFSLYFQPRVNIATSTIVGAEALLRWKHPDKGMVSPAEFIPILETSGLIVDVGMWIIEQSIHQVKQWREKGIWSDEMRLGVNISPRQFRSSSFVDNVIRLLEREAFPAGMLEMEITEGIVIHNLEETISTMATLRSHGINFALDDFGTGYSSISYLKQLPVSILKVDQSFVRDITFDRNDRVLVETISAMGSMLGLEVVAEGVESPEQLALIREYQCAYYQGYLCSPPVIPDEFVRLLERKTVSWVK